MGLHVQHGANNIDIVNSIFEANKGVSIYVEGGDQVNINGCVLEGNGGPAILANRVRGLSIISNYFVSDFCASVLALRIPAGVIQFGILCVQSVAVVTCK